MKRIAGLLGRGLAAAARWGLSFVSSHPEVLRSIGEKATPTVEEVLSLRRSQTDSITAKRTKGEKRK